MPACDGAAAAPHCGPTRRHPSPSPPCPRHYPGLKLVHEEPPVYIARGFLPPGDCEALRRAAEAGQLPRLQYDNVRGGWGGGGGGPWGVG